MVGTLPRKVSLRATSRCDRASLVGQRCVDLLEVCADDRRAAIDDSDRDRHHAHLDHVCLGALIGVDVFDLELEVLAGEMILHLRARASTSAAVDDYLFLFCHVESLTSERLDENSVREFRA